jgi:membrane-bound lytic murein transglycosylase A
MINYFKLLPFLLLFTACTPPFSSVSLTDDQPIELQSIEIEQLQLWENLEFDKALLSFQSSCQRIKKNTLFYKTCQKSQDTTSAKVFFRDNFSAYRWEDSTKEKKGLMTGYYEPLLSGRLHRDENHTIPLLSPPNDLIKVRLNSVIPELKGKVVRGRIKGNQLIPYYSREEITAQKNPSNVICWVNNKVDLFFLQIQGSGRIQLDNNQTIFVGYGDKNGHPYRSIGKYMIDHKIMSYGEMSLQGIKRWANHNPEKIDAILNQNPSYLFFVKNSTPAKGAMGVVLTPEHSLAVDTSFIPLGAPIFIDTKHPLTGKPFQALAITQDKGTAIKGERRLDFFWGFGNKAAQLAGHTKSRADMIILLPKEYQVN